MKRFLVACIVGMFAVACENAFVEEAQFIPVAGKWAKVGDDGLVSRYIEFENGVYSEYNAKPLVAYFEGALWGCTDAYFERVTNQEYSIVGNDLILSGRPSSNITLTSPTTLKINNIRYDKITSFNDQYYRQIDVEEEVSIDYSTVSVTIPCEISNADKDVEIDIEYSANWVNSVVFNKNELLVRCSQNKSALKRTALVTLSYAGAENRTISIVQARNVVSPDNAIVYTTTDNKKITTITSSGFDATITSHTYEDGVGVIAFDEPITQINAGAFQKQKTLATITIPYGVTTIGESAFFDCTSLTSIRIPDSVIEIGDATFRSCILLSDFTIPKSVALIGERAFYDCRALISVTIPDSVTEIGAAAFGACDNLESFYGKFASSDNRCLIVDGVLNSFAQAGISSYTIGDNVTKIGKLCFAYCVNIECVIISNSATDIGDSAFWYCTSLESVAIPDNVRSIGDWAFYNCTLLRNVTIPDHVTSIGLETFYNCSSLTSITIPNSCVIIAHDAFWNCDSLTSITIPNSVTNIGVSAFGACDNLESFYGKYASSDNRCLIVDGVLNSFAPAGLTSYTISDEVGTIGSNSFFGCTSLEEVIIPNSVNQIGQYAFQSCTSLKKVNILDGVYEISRYAFSVCLSLESITIPDSVYYIHEGAFWQCDSLTNITIPASVEYIGDGAFYQCPILQSVYCKSTTPPAMSSSNWAFDDNAPNRTIYVPRASVSKYKSASGWSDYSSAIVGYDF